MNRIFCKVVLIAGLAASTSALASMITVPIYSTTNEGKGTFVGNIVISESKYGVILTPDLHGMAPGLHGFHVHENPSCDMKGGGAGGHLDPQKTGMHRGPYDDSGHLGDLPVLYVSPAGTATAPMLAPRFKDIAQFKQHALMIHEGGDNYSDTPEKLGGGGGRMYCGVIE